MAQMIKFATPRKDGDGPWSFGDDAFVNPAHVIAIEPAEHRYHSYRPAQSFTRIHLSTGAVLEVFACARAVAEAVRKAGEPPPPSSGDPELDAMASEVRQRAVAAGVIQTPAAEAMPLDDDLPAGPEDT
jgi:hypothetical protein